MGKRKYLAVFLIVFTVMLSSFTFYGYQLIYTPNVLVEAPENIILSINKETTFKELQSKLGDSKIVNDLVAFSFVAKILGYHRNVQPGHYTLTPNMTNIELIRFLDRGNPPVRVTIHSARSIQDISKVLAKYLFLDSADFARHFADPSVQERYSKTEENLIGLFLPDTYEFYYKATPEEILERINTIYTKYWTENKTQKAKNLNLTKEEIITLASIVKAETAKLDEAPRVAGVYYNRLESGMKLQADPTLIYALNDYTIRRVRKGDREIESPYNTYKYEGLPPGPINMPESVYIDAVLNLEHHDFIFFCADAELNGYHLFAKSYATHLKNARKLWKALNERQIDR